MPWIWSPEPTHEALVDRDDWQRVQLVQNRNPRSPRRHDTSYLLREASAARSVGDAWLGRSEAQIVATTAVNCGAAGLAHPWTTPLTSMCAGAPRSGSL